MTRVQLRVIVEKDNPHPSPRYVAIVDEPTMPRYNGIIGMSRESIENVFYDLKFEVFRRTGQIVDLYI